MSSADDPQEIKNGIEVLNALAVLLADPTFLPKLSKALKSLRQEAKKVEFEAKKREPLKGTCPTCGRKYGINKDGTLRRHKGESVHCQFDRQLPAEIIPAVLAIAQLGDDRGEATSDDGTGKPV